MDPNLTIEKTLTDSDTSTQGYLYLPKPKIDNILRKFGISLPRNGVQVEILDNTNSYWVNLNQNYNRCYVGHGWKSLRDARGLKTGDNIKLYWSDTKFIFTTK